MTKDDIIGKLELEPHPEGGWHRRTYVSGTEIGGRGTASAIYFLLEGSLPSLWHRTGADELWFWHAGSALELEVATDGETPVVTVIGPDITAGESPQAMVPGDKWQRSRSLGDWTLVSCAVTPEFKYSDFEMQTDRNWMP